MIECYVLDAIGELDASDRAGLEATASETAKALGVSADTWQGALDEALELPDDFRDVLSRNWVEQSAAARAAGAEPSPQAFAEAWADAFDAASR